MRYERHSVQLYLKDSQRSPLTRAPGFRIVERNVGLRKAIADFVERSAQRDCARDRYANIHFVELGLALTKFHFSIIKQCKNT